MTHEDKFSRISQKRILAFMKNLVALTFPNKLLRMIESLVNLTETNKDVPILKMLIELTDQFSI